MKESTKLFDSRYMWPFILVTTLFQFLGIPNNLNDVLIRQFMKSIAAMKHAGEWDGFLKSEILRVVYPYCSRICRTGLDIPDVKS